MEVATGGSDSEVGEPVKSNSDFLIVARPDPFNPGNSFEVKDPRRTYDRCEAIHKKRGRSEALHRDGCRHCGELIDACHDAALMFEMLCRLDPDSTAPGAKAWEAVGFEVLDE